MHTIQVRMAYLIPPRQHDGWDHEKPRSLVTAIVERFCCRATVSFELFKSEFN